MKSLLLQLLWLDLCLALQQQQPLNELRFPWMGEIGGNNNATYGPVPKADQLFAIESLDIAPSPIPVDQTLFVLIHGELRKDKLEKQQNHPRRDLNNELNNDEPDQQQSDSNHDSPDDLLANTTLTITISAILEDGKPDKPWSGTVPFRTMSFGLAAVSIRNETGTWVDHLGIGEYEILADYSGIPSVFLRTGNYTFEVVTRLGDGRCLFALTLRQWLEGWSH